MKQYCRSIFLKCSLKDVSLGLNALETHISLASPPGIEPGTKDLPSPQHTSKDSMRDGSEVLRWHCAWRFRHIAPRSKYLEPEQSLYGMA